MTAHPFASDTGLWRVDGGGMRSWRTSASGGTCAARSKGVDIPSIRLAGGFGNGRLSVPAGGLGAVRRSAASGAPPGKVAGSRRAACRGIPCIPPRPVHPCIPRAPCIPCIRRAQCVPRHPCIPPRGRTWCRASSRGCRGPWCGTRTGAAPRPVGEPRRAQAVARARARAPGRGRGRGGGGGASGGVRRHTVPVPGPTRPSGPYAAPWPAARGRPAVARARSGRR